MTERQRETAVMKGVKKGVAYNAELAGRSMLTRK